MANINNMIFHNESPFLRSLIKTNTDTSVTVIRKKVKYQWGKFIKLKNRNMPQKKYIHFMISS